MIRIRFLRSTALILALSAAAPAFAQEVVAVPNPDADRLAGEVRRLASDPRDTLALLDAGDLSARLGDTSAALAFFQRAEAIDPTNPRILSGRASTLVRLERPGEALRLFQQAEARGLRVSQFASDRGWVYDLLGAPDLAQRDYRTALATFRDDETVRRYALSLGITGDVDQAMKELDPLLRRSDRASWRARAFILAMNGDLAGADRIASTMMPGNMGAALSPFFRRLAGLSPADRAFAVHFGELSPTQARLADARMAPDVPQWSPQPKPVVVAAAPPQPVAQAQPGRKDRDRRSRRERERDERDAVAAAARRPAEPVAVAVKEPDLPPPPQYVERREIVQATPAPTPTPAPVQLASNRTMPLPERFSVDRPAPRPMMAEPQPETLRAKPAPERRIGREDATLASIVNGITIPAEELDAVSRPPEPQPEPVRIAEVAPKPVAPKPAPVAKPEPAKPDPAPAKAKPDAKTPAKPDPKAKKPDPAAAAKKPDPKKPDPAKTEPSRTWVQVAGGANETTLSKAWQAVAAKAPAAMKGKTPWTAPLRATNRVLAGPFKSSAEAQAFVNTLGKAGVSAFVFTSEAGQKITRLTLK
ncbi:MAG: SPOR domain-containing protein [Sphingomonas sp.]|uniref:SPOR domain-containing protein n=1 Tax=Sphingomonas sp. TaxID=28214 RepID=UPI0025F7D723|nr:SPOR domain-containing protein [Sphingomonas sp.]MBX3564219.1 SPOR domain-containing protein [Sphingomonas sp.]